MITTLVVGYSLPEFIQQLTQSLIHNGSQGAQFANLTITNDVRLGPGVVFRGHMVFCSPTLRDLPFMSRKLVDNIIFNRVTDDTLQCLVTQINAETQNGWQRITIKRTPVLTASCTSAGDVRDLF